MRSPFRGELVQDVRRLSRKSIKQHSQKQKMRQGKGWKRTKCVGTRVRVSNLTEQKNLSRLRSWNDGFKQQMGKKRIVYHWSFQGLVISGQFTALDFCISFSQVTFINGIEARSAFIVFYTWPSSIVVRLSIEDLIFKKGNKYEDGPNWKYLYIKIVREEKSKRKVGKL